MKKHLPVTSVVVVIVSIWFLVFALNTVGFSFLWSNRIAYWLRGSKQSAGLTVRVLLLLASIYFCFSFFLCLAAATWLLRWGAMRRQWYCGRPHAEIE